MTMKELKRYTINGHTITLCSDNVMATPFFVVTVDGKVTAAGKDRMTIVDEFDAACQRASAKEA